MTFTQISCRGPYCRAVSSTLAFEREMCMGRKGIDHWRDSLLQWRIFPRARNRKRETSFPPMLCSASPPFSVDRFFPFVLLDAALPDNAATHLSFFVSASPRSDERLRHIRSPLAVMEPDSRDVDSYTFMICVLLIWGWQMHTNIIVHRVELVFNGCDPKQRNTAVSWKIQSEAVYTEVGRDVKVRLLEHNSIDACTARPSMHYVHLA